MPSHRHHDFGNLYVKFDVVFPTMEEFVEDERVDKIPYLKEILPEPRQTIPIPSNAMVEDYDLDLLDPNQQIRAQTGTGAEDDEEAAGGAERVQCASQ